MLALGLIAGAFLFINVEQWEFDGGGAGVARPASRKLVSPTLLLLCSEWSRRALSCSSSHVARELRLLASALQDASPYGSPGSARAALLNDTFRSSNRGLIAHSCASKRATLWAQLARHTPNLEQPQIAAARAQARAHSTQPPCAAPQRQDVRRHGRRRDGRLRRRCWYCGVEVRFGGEDAPKGVLSSRLGCVFDQKSSLRQR